jgi:hypothetical protein
MWITSLTTLVMGTPEQPLYISPQTPVELPLQEAKSLIERGLAIQVTKPSNKEASP